MNEKITELQKELSTTKYNKRSQHHIGLIKAKIAVLKKKDEARSQSKGGGEGYSVRRSGDATAILVGFPSVGKSTLLNALTNANSEVGAYAFTTLKVIPGTLDINDAKIQILDVPGIVKGAASGTGRGKEVLGCIRNADLVIFVIDVFAPEHLNVLRSEVYNSNLRVNSVPPDVKLVKTSRGGIDVGSTVKLTKTTNKTIESILKEFRINNARITIRTDISAEELIDVIENNKHYVPGITVLTKIDLAQKETLARARRLVNPDMEVSAEKDINIESLKELIFSSLSLIRVFTKEARKPPDMTEPLIMKSDCTIKAVCDKLHKDFTSKFKFARLWGSSKFPGQIIKKLKTPIRDRDIVEIHTR
jgi:uncharacterized protein